MGRVRREDCLPCFLAVDVVRRVSRMRVVCFIVVFCGCIVYLEFGIDSICCID